MNILEIAVFNYQSALRRTGWHETVLELRMLPRWNGSSQEQDGVKG